MKIFFRIANPKTNQGLWYDYEGKFTGLIHLEYNFCKNSNLQMPFNKDLVGYLSATETLDELFNWFSKEDIEQLEKFGYRITVYKANDYKFYNNHWLISQQTSMIVKRLSIATICTLDTI